MPDSFRRFRRADARHTDRHSRHEQGCATRSLFAKCKQTFRPSHADFTYEAKYGIRNWQGGGRASARETVGRVAAGAVARKVLRNLHPEFEIVAYVTQVHEIIAAIDRSVREAGGGRAKCGALSG